jgi:hypothetical protein
MLFPNKMLSREAAVERYGAIDFASLSWPNAPTWIKMFEVPQGVFPNWKVLRTQIPVTHIACNLDMHRPLQMALDAMVNAGIADQLHTFDGAFNIRMVRGSSTLFSAHSYGLAIDINADENILGGQTNISQEMIQVFQTVGFDWGGYFHRVDGMHWSYCFEGSNPL